MSAELVTAGVDGAQAEVLVNFPVVNVDREAGTITGAVESEQYPSAVQLPGVEVVLNNVDPATAAYSQSQGNSARCQGGGSNNGN